ncbi:MAG: MBL fold metallo-hydrolase [Candidatus Dadabacteria bacterium]|nr:MBL fold metallo-hydrolase [Candidatus Dadabacteria bacterium]
MILRCIPGGIFLTNCYILGDEKTNEGILIDPGEQIDDIMREVKKSGLKITKIVNTHTHIDHVAGAEAAKKALGVGFYIHPEEVPVLELLPESAQRFPQFGDVEVPEVEGFVEEGDEVEIGGLRAKVLHTPGHTWGSICLVIGDVVISGDTLFAGSVGRVDLTGGTSMAELVGSIKSKLMPLPDSYKVYPGHGPATTIGIEKKSNPFITGGFSFL